MIKPHPDLLVALTWSQVVEAAETPARILLRVALLVGVGLVLRHLAHRLIDRLVTRAVGLTLPKPLRGDRRGDDARERPTLQQERRAQRAQALGSLFKSATTALVGVVVVLMILDELGYSLAPLLASAGVAGIAIGFGAQSLVKDFLAGIFMLLEDQYGVGDVVDLDVAVGTVESVGLRVTRVRDSDGVLWHIRNGEILRVGNKSQGWSALVLDIAVAYDEDIHRVERLVDQQAREIAASDQWKDKILETPHVVGVEEVTGQSITIRIEGKCLPNEQFGIQRELRSRLKKAFDAEGVRVPA
ncbi:mechanosensitive ion channel family protein [Thermasporomyces composti]|jgi:moderate conductance mechanosensitive channel|uniref:Small conductance mechanosensitive channel n=1 Tax=Thermasporomyces composti TaxID=696763 RepID=A0A3D9V8F9_THECX|nr:mechanosensitive ion channel family protein [Thermasporomyces composti]REF37759.1 small conductance mechanosensitive channel [Thermasporomyces composti]